MIVNEALAAPIIATVDCTESPLRWILATKSIRRSAREFGWSSARQGLPTIVSSYC